MMFKEILLAFSHLKVYCFTNGFEMRFFWSFSFWSKSTIAAPCGFGFEEKILLVLFFWIVVSNIPRLLSNAIMIMFARLVSNIPRLLSSISRLLLARFGQDMDKPLATDVLKTKVKISLFTILFTNYCSQSLFTFTIHFEFLPI